MSTKCWTPSRHCNYPHTEENGVESRGRLSATLSSYYVDFATLMNLSVRPCCLIFFMTVDLVQHALKRFRGRPELTVDLKPGKACAICGLRLVLFRFRCLVFYRSWPGLQHSLHQGSQRNGEENSPETPQPPEKQDGKNNGDRVQVDSLGKQ